MVRAHTTGKAISSGCRWTSREDDSGRHRLGRAGPGSEQFPPSRLPAPPPLPHPRCSLLWVFFSPLVSASLNIYRINAFRWTMIIFFLVAYLREREVSHGFQLLRKPATAAEGTVTFLEDGPQALWARHSSLTELLSRCSWIPTSNPSARALQCWLCEDFNARHAANNHRPAGSFRPSVPGLPADSRALPSPGSPLVPTHRCMPPATASQGLQQVASLGSPLPLGRPRDGGDGWNPRGGGHHRPYYLSGHCGVMQGLGQPPLMTTNSEITEVGHSSRLEHRLTRSGPALVITPGSDSRRHNQPQNLATGRSCTPSRPLPHALGLLPMGRDTGHVKVGCRKQIGAQTDSRRRKGVHYPSSAYSSYHLNIYSSNIVSVCVSTGNHQNGGPPAALRGAKLGFCARNLTAGGVNVCKWTMTFPLYSLAQRTKSVTPRPAPGGLWLHARGPWSLLEDGAQPPWPCQSSPTAILLWHFHSNGDSVSKGFTTLVVQSFSMNSTCCSRISLKFSNNPCSSGMGNFIHKF